MESIVSLSRIQREATAAASGDSDSSAAICPYPCGSAAAIKFKEFFNHAKAQAIANNRSTE